MVQNARFMDETKLPEVEALHVVLKTVRLLPECQAANDESPAALRKYIRQGSEIPSGG